jgi:putative resolvase
MMDFVQVMNSYAAFHLPYAGTLFMKKTRFEMLTRLNFYLIERKRTDSITTGLDGMANQPKYATPRNIQKLYDISQSTLRQWAESGKVSVIRHPEGKRKRLYLLSDIEQRMGVPDVPEAKVGGRIQAIYARVSSAKQAGDLERQIADLRTQYPNHKLYSDIASGLNFNRKGFQTLLEQILSRNVEEVVVMHRDRLCRFAVELMESIFKATGTRFVVLGNYEHSTPESELAEDMLSIATVFVAKNNGMRSAQHRKRRATNQEDKDRDQPKTAQEDGPQTNQEEKDEYKCKRRKTAQGPKTKEDTARKVPKVATETKPGTKKDLK